MGGCGMTSGMTTGGAERGGATAANSGEAAGAANSADAGASLSTSETAVAVEDAPRCGLTLDPKKAKGSATGAELAWLCAAGRMGLPNKSSGVPGAGGWRGTSCRAKSRGNCLT